MCVCVFFLYISALNALSRCVVFRQCTCQDVSSLGRGPCVCVCVCVCVYVCVLYYLCPKCIVKMCRLWAGALCVCVCMCVCSFFYFCPKCIVKMCCLSAMHLSRCRISVGGLVCVCAFFLFISALNALSRCVVFWQCTCQDVSSLAGDLVCVCVSSLFVP